MDLQSLEIYYFFSLLLYSVNNNLQNIGMDIEGYRLKKKNEVAPVRRDDRRHCLACWQPKFNCFCHVVNKFDPNIEFVVLIHPIEARRRVATGRMSYLSLENSHILKGSDFAGDTQLNNLLNEPGYRNIVLSPGLHATNLTGMPQEKICEHFPRDKKLRVFVLDGTWTTAKKMFNRTPELQKLKRYFFIPETQSNIRVRKQPNEKCYCTLEAIHHTIELLGPSQGFDTATGLHDNLLKPFDWMVDSQIDRIKNNRNWRS